MYTEGQDKAKVGVVTVDTHGKSYRIRFMYPQGTRHQFTVAKVTPEGWTTAIKAAQLINRDIDLGDFDESYARYSPKHARKLEIAKEEKIKEYTLKELWEIYKEANKDRVAKTTQKSNWVHFDSFFEQVTPKSLKPENSYLFVEELLQIYSSGTLEGLFSKCLYLSVNQAVKKGLIKENPYKHIPLPKTQKKAIECFESSEVKAIVGAFYSNEYCAKKSAYKHDYYALMVDFLALTGCRPEECHALTWNDIKRRGDKMFISFNKAYSKGILLPHTKSRTIRLFPCNEQLKRLVNSIPRIKNKHNLIFPSVELGYVNQDNFRRRYYVKVLNGLVKDDRVHKYLKPYCLRHSFITRLIREGVDIATVAALSGNSPETIIKYYLASRKEFDLPEL